jgi:hypothetical protein
MSEPERGRQKGFADPGPDDERLRLFLKAAYPAAEPTEALGRSVAELIARHRAGKVQSAGWRHIRQTRWRAAGVLAATALVAVIGVAFVRWQQARSKAPSPIAIATSPHAPQDAVGSQSTARATSPGPRAGNIRGWARGKLSLVHPRLPRTHRRAWPPTRTTDDMAFINQNPEAAARQWVVLPPDEWDNVETRVRRVVRVRDDFVTIPFPRLASTSGRQIAEAVESYRREAAIVDPRLSREVTLQSKGTALSDLCDRLHEETGIRLEAGRSVADEKVTIFCEKTPLRDVMRQLSRPFGYTWLRSRLPARSSELQAKAGPASAGGREPGVGSHGEPAYRYELVQDLRSQLLEEELRNRDRNAALLALDAQMQAYRSYVDLSVDELQKRSAQGGESAKLLAGMAQNGSWGGIQLYHRLTPRDRAALLAGQELVFRPDAPDPDRRLPAEWSRPILQSLSHHADANGRLTPINVDVDGRPTLLSELPGIRVTTARLKLNRSELGQVSLVVMVTEAFNDAHGERLGFNLRELATHRTPSAANPDNATANAALRGRPPFDRRVTVQPKSSCPTAQILPPAVHDPDDQVGDLASPHVSSADVWEAVHRATGLPIVADSYTRLYPVEKVTVPRRPLFEALCAVGDALGARWRKDGDFLVCRSASYFWDRLKEVPNRYLQRWAKSRDANGGLPLAEFLEMATLTDQQLDSVPVAEGIEQCWGLREWGWLGGAELEGRLQRQHARFLATLTPDQQQRALEPAGLPFRELTAAQQQGCVQLKYESQEAIEREEGAAPPIRPGDFANAEISATYIPAGWFVAPVPPESARERPWTGPMWRVGGRTVAEAMAAARRLLPNSPPPEVRRARDGYFSAGVSFTYR